MSERDDERQAAELRISMLEKDLREREGEVLDLERQLAALRDDLAAARALAGETVGGIVEVEAERDAALARIQALAGADAELRALRATKLFRWSSGPRNAYGRLRARLRTGRRVS